MPGAGQAVPTAPIKIQPSHIIQTHVFKFYIPSINAEFSIKAEESMLFERIVASQCEV